MTLTFPLVPMKAVPGLLPPAGEADRWGYELKWDGMRIVAFVGADGSVRLQSARPREVTVSFPELSVLGQATAGRAAVLDGEVVAVDDSGRPSFGRLQQRMHVVSPPEVARRAAAVPVAYQVFDLLAFDGHDATALPYRERRRLLEGVVVPGPYWSVPANHTDGAALLERVRDLGLEGIVAKRWDSPYLVGRRSPSWRKIKARNRQEFVVGGWAPGAGRRSGRPASLLLGVHDGGVLRYAGRVGTGFTDAELDRLSGLLEPLRRERCPFVAEPSPGRRGSAAEPVWVEPVLVVEVEYAEWTGDDVLRHPSYVGLRADKDPDDVTDERPAG